MESWKLLPFKSAGPINFNDTKEDIVKKLGEPKSVSPKGGYFCFSWGHIKFFFEDKIEDIVIHPKEECEIDILYNSVLLNCLDYKKTVKILFQQKNKIYGDFISSSPGYTIENLGVSLVTYENDYRDKIKNGWFSKIELSALVILSQGELKLQMQQRW